MAALDALRTAIGWGPGSWFLAPMIAAGGRVLAARAEDGELEAMGGSTVFQPSGFICNMVVRPDLKRRGLGRQIFEALLDWHASAGRETVQLEATEEGKPLYEQYGFRVRWESIASTLVTPPGRPTSGEIRELVPADWPAVAELDRLANGTDRYVLLQSLTFGTNFEGGAVAERNGRVVAYGLRFSGRIGPVVAVDAQAAELVVRELASRSDPGTLATIGHPAQAPLWERLGFEVSAFDVRMVRGADPADDPAMVFCMLNGGAG